MKKITSLLLCLLLVFVLCACGGETNKPGSTGTTEDVAYDPVNHDKTLKVLAIGNSFSDDTTYFLEDIAKAEGFETVAIGNLYIGGCTLETHVKNAEENLPAYKFYMNYDGEWKIMENCTLAYGLQHQDWDIITMQQASHDSGMPGSYEDNLTKLIQYVNENKTNPKAKLAWNMTWAYQADSTHSAFPRYNNDQETMYNAIVNAVKTKVVPHSEISYIIPAGTAIQNARTSYIGDNLTRDGYHMNELGRVITSYTWLATFMGKPLEQINFTNVSAVLTLTESDKAVIMEAVNAAIAQPFAVTTSVITEKN